MILSYAIFARTSPLFTTWFDEADGSSAITLIADFEGGLLIADNNYSYPVLIYDVSRSAIHYDRQKTQDLKTAVCSLGR